MIKLLKQLFPFLFGSAEPEVTRVAREAAACKTTALGNVEDAKRALAAATTAALTTIRSSETAISDAVEADKAAEATRETERAGEVAAVVKQGEDAIAALVEALRIARENAAKAKSEVEAEHADERQAATDRVNAANTTLDELKAAEAALEAGDCK
jgi:hypothetical protein